MRLSHILRKIPFFGFSLSTPSISQNTAARNQSSPTSPPTQSANGRPPTPNSLDHAVELLYHPTATEVPCKQLALSATATFFTYLPKSHASHPDDADTITQLFLAAFASFGFLGQNTKGGLGLSHSMGYALGSPYGIPHGVTSCLTLGPVMKLKARASKDDAAQIARILPVIGQRRSGDDVADAVKAGDAVSDLVQRLGLKTTLTERGVGPDQLEIIVKRATGGQTEGPVYDAVKNLTKSLY